MFVFVVYLIFCIFCLQVAGPDVTVPNSLMSASLQDKVPSLMDSSAVIPEGSGKPMGKHIYAATVSSEMYEWHYRGFLGKVIIIVFYNEMFLEES